MANSVSEVRSPLGPYLPLVYLKSDISNFLAGFLFIRMLCIATHKVEAAEDGAGNQNDRGRVYRKSEHHKAGLLKRLNRHSNMGGAPKTAPAAKLSQCAACYCELICRRMDGAVPALLRRLNRASESRCWLCPVG